MPLQFLLVALVTRLQFLRLGFTLCQPLFDRADLPGLRFQAPARALLLDPQLRNLTAGFGQLPFPPVTLLLHPLLFAFALGHLPPPILNLPAAPFYAPPRF